MSGFPSALQWHAALAINDMGEGNRISAINVRGALPLTITGYAALVTIFGKGKGKSETP
jgi:hypothetical protein